MFKSVFVPLDGSQASAAALRPAAAMAQYLNCDLLVVAFADRSQTIAQLRTIIDSQTESLDCNVTVDVQLRTGPVSDLIGHTLSELEEPLVVMATRGQGRTAALVGSVATEVLALRTAPVMLIGPNCDLDTFCIGGPMVVATDSSPGAKTALDLAAQAAEAFDYEPVIVNVVAPKASRAMSSASSGAFTHDAASESAMVQRLTRELGRTIGQPGLGFEVLHDKHPGAAIAGFASDISAPLIVLATHARTGLALFRVGSVTAQAVTQAQCPVLAVAPAHTDGDDG